MSTLDLGEIEAPLLVFGGPYGNLDAARAMRETARRLGIAPERTICTGDLVAYCAHPAETVALIRDWGVPVVMGNVEESLGAGAGDCGCGFEPGSACDRLSERWYAHAAAALDGATKRWMAGLPRQIRFRMAGRRIAAVHGAPSAIARFIFASAPESAMRAELAAADADGIVAGHCGLPFVADWADGFWLNAGAIGMPANDGTRRVWYAVLQPARTGIAATLQPLDYDAEAAAAAMRAGDLPAAYADTLLSGLWPSLDILPSVERAAAGRALGVVRRSDLGGRTRQAA